MLNVFRMTAVVLLAVPSAIYAQTFNSIPEIAFDSSGPVLRAHTESQKPLTVAGERGVILGQQDGTFEAWVLPVKLLSHLTIEARIAGYSACVVALQAKIRFRRQSIARIGLQLNNFSFPRCLNGRIEE
jgi:photosystem II stability/assembly factor-like uncharacterized protein